MLTDLPNLLTLGRIVAIPALVALAALGAAGGDLAACAVFAAAGITDFLDGRIARARGQTSDLGRMMDPIADKLLVGAALMMLAGTGRAGRFGLYAAIVIVLRELMVSGLREYLAQFDVRLPATRLAKWKTAAQMGAIGLLLAGGDGAAAIGLGWVPVVEIGTGLLWIAAALTLVTGAAYLDAAIRALSRPAEAAE